MDECENSEMVEEGVEMADVCSQVQPERSCNDHQSYTSPMARRNERSSKLVKFALAFSCVAVFLIWLNSPGFENVTDPILMHLWNKRSEHSNLWRAIQTMFGCCGLDNALQWIPNTPRSCCKRKDVECSALDLPNVHLDGCRALLHKFLLFWLNLIGLFIILFIFIGVIC